jgi:hypothetical protein
MAWHKDPRLPAVERLRLRRPVLPIYRQEAVKAMGQWEEYNYNHPVEHSPAPAEHILASAEYTPAPAAHILASAEHIRAQTDHNPVLVEYIQALAEYIQALIDHILALVEYIQA